MRTCRAGIAQLVERNLAKVEVASSRLVSRSKVFRGKRFAFPFCFRILVWWVRASGGVAEWLCSGLQSRVPRFDSGPRLHVLLSVRLLPSFLGYVFDWAAPCYALGIADIAWKS